MTLHKRPVTLFPNVDRNSVLTQTCPLKFDNETEGVFKYDHGSCIFYPAPSIRMRNLSISSNIQKFHIN